jgi:hypothetical protein
MREFSPSDKVPCFSMQIDQSRSISYSPRSRRTRIPFSLHLHPLSNHSGNICLQEVTLPLSAESFRREILHSCCQESPWSQRCLMCILARLPGCERQAMSVVFARNMKQHVVSVWAKPRSIIPGSVTHAGMESRRDDVARNRIARRVRLFVQMSCISPGLST